MTKTLNIIHADIAWFCDPWRTLDYEERNGNHFIRGIDGPLNKTNWGDETKNPANESPEFWKHVSENWFYAFKRKNAGQNDVERYYSMYGPLNVYGWRMNDRVHDSERKLLTGRKGLEESWELNERALGWFNKLAQMTEWLIAGNVTKLRKHYFGEPRPLAKAESTLVFYPDEGFEPGRGKGRPFYSILSHPYIDPANPLDEKFSPRDDFEILQETWFTITEEVQKLLNLISLSPVTVIKDGDRNLTWRFNPDGAFEAAFLQWYLAKVANIKNEPCANPRCKNLARPGSAYCGRRDKGDKHFLCELAAAKQRQRFRQREAKRLHAEGYDLKKIITEIYPAEEKQRLEDMGKSVNGIVAGWVSKK